MIKVFCEEEMREQVKERFEELLQSACEDVDCDEDEIVLSVTEEGVKAIIPEDEIYGFVDYYPPSVAGAIKTLKEEFADIGIDGCCWFRNYEEEYTDGLYFSCGKDDDNVSLEKIKRCIVCGTILPESSDCFMKAENDALCICKKECASEMLEEEEYDEVDLQHFLTEDELAEAEEADDYEEEIIEIVKRKIEAIL